MFAKSLKISGVEDIKIQVSYDSEHLATKTKRPSKFIVYQEIWEENDLDRRGEYER